MEMKAILALILIPIAGLAKRAPGPEATLFYGMNTDYALSQVLCALLGLLVARAPLNLLDQWPTVSLSLAAVVCREVFGFVFIGYWEPKIAAGIFAVLVIVAAATA
jgi:hypothetical protein